MLSERKMGRGEKIRVKTTVLCKPSSRTTDFIADFPSPAHIFGRDIAPIIKDVIIGAYHTPHRSAQARSHVMNSNLRKPCCVLSSCLKQILLPEEKRNTPDCAYTYQHIDYSADNGSLSAKDKRYQIKLENTDKTPVDTADYQQQQCYTIQHLDSPFLSAFIMRGFRADIHFFHKLFFST